MTDQPIMWLRGDRSGRRSAVPYWEKDGFQGILILGGTGSGKTSYSGAQIATGLLAVRATEASTQFGGLVLCAKDEELALWAAPASEGRPGGYVARAGREQSHITAFGARADLYREMGLAQPRGTPALNFLDYERLLYRRLGFPCTPNLVATLDAALGDSGNGANTDPYWRDASRQLVTNAIDLVDLAGEPMSLDLITQVILSAPQSGEEVRARRWQDTYCASLLKTACGREDLSAPQQLDLCETIRYWASEYPNLAERTRSVIVSTFTSRASGLLRAPFRQMFCGPTTLPPDATHRGQVVILDLPVKTYGDAGRHAQVLIKTVWQKATEWRAVTGAGNPVFLWADEAQYFVTRHDVAFQQTARSSRAATVYLTQSLANLYAALGDSSRSLTDSLLGCLQTKIFHANSDVGTNEWAERLFGYRTTYQANFGATEPGTPGGAPSSSSGLQPTRVPRVAAHEFASLRTPATGNHSDAFVFCLGKEWGGQEGALAWLETFVRDDVRKGGHR